jgi:hypothetical protein
MACRRLIEGRVMNRLSGNRVAFVIVLTCFVLCDRCAIGIVLHPDGEPNLATWTDRPDANIIGRWGSNASCIAISENAVITARHQGGGIGTTVEIGGNSYIVADVCNCGAADLRIAELYAANLESYAEVFTDTNEIGQEIVVSGYGDGRGGLLQTGGTTYGYWWDNSSNTTLRFGTNEIDAVADNNTVAGYTSDVVIADFDGLGEGGFTTYEAALGMHDSGGGWFIKVGEGWSLAGLSRGVEHGGESWFRNKMFPSELDPDIIDAVRISSYSAWSLENIPAYVGGDLSGDGCVDFADFAILAYYWGGTCESPGHCEGADFEPDGDVDGFDLCFLTERWLTGAESI